MNLRIKFLAVTIILVSGATAHAWNTSGCSALLNNGWFKKYKYEGVDGAAGNATTKNPIEGTSATSTEGSTASSDPKYWSNRMTSATQYMSSWGPCSLIGMDEIRERREKYFAQNRDEILKDIASGQGEHVKVLATFALCEEDSTTAYGTELQKNINHLIHPNGTYGEVLDGIVKKDAFLSKKCWSQST